LTQVTNPYKVRRRAQYPSRNHRTFHCALLLQAPRLSLWAQAFIGFDPTRLIHGPVGSGAALNLFSCQVSRSSRARANGFSKARAANVLWNFGFWNRFTELFRVKPPESSTSCSHAYAVPDWYCIFAGGTFPRFSTRCPHGLCAAARCFLLPFKDIDVWRLTVTVYESIFLCVTLPTF